MLRSFSLTASFPDKLSYFPLLLLKRNPSSVKIIAVLFSNPLHIALKNGLFSIHLIHCHCIGLDSLLSHSLHSAIFLFTKC